MARAWCGSEIGDLRRLADEAPEQRRPHVLMRVDETGHGDEARSVDVRPTACELRAHSGNPPVAHMDVRAAQIADGRIHGEHDGVADGEFASRRKPGRLREGTRRAQPAREASGSRGAYGAQECATLHENLLTAHEWHLDRRMFWSNRDNGRMVKRMACPLEGLKPARL